MSNFKTYDTDVLVIGDGLAGLQAACRAAQTGCKVLVVSEGGGASHEIMGFNAVTDNHDSTDRYCADLIKSSCGICDKHLARILAEQSGEAARQLKALGLAFDLDSHGAYDALLTLGCSYPRLLHSGSYTGKKAMDLLRGICMDQKVQFYKPIQIVKLLTADGKVIGAAGVNCSTAAFNVFWAKAVVLAAGGGSAIHRISTYPPGLVGSGYRLAYDAGAELTDMEFLQYEPCCFIYPDTVRGRLAVTTLLFEGGELRNKDGEPFVRKFSPGGYHIQKYLLARLIMQEIVAGRGSKHGGVFYDVTSVAQSRVKTDNAIFYEPALTGGVDMLKEYAEVAPVAHTFLGGVVIDSSCATAAAGLFAAGEVAGGVHGANRIGGCSGADTLVFGAIAGSSAAAFAAGRNFVAQPRLAEAEAVDFDRQLQKAQTFHGHKSPQWFLAELGSLLDEKANILKSEEDLTECERRIELLRIAAESASIKNFADVSAFYKCRSAFFTARMHISASLMRRESRGVFYRSDYPQEDDGRFQKSIVFHRPASVDLRDR